MGVVVNSSTDRLRRTSGTMPATTSDFTACGWFYFGTDVNGYSTIFCINNSTTTATDGWYLQTVSDGSTLAIWDQDASAWYTANIGAMTTGNWYHCAVRKNGTNLRGSFRLISATTYTTAVCDNAPADTFTAANIEFGNTYSSDYANGTVSNWKIFQADLTDAELLQESRRFMPSRWANLWAWYPMLNTGGQDYGPNAYSLNVSTNTTVGDNPPIPWGGRSVFFPFAVAGGTLYLQSADGGMTPAGALFRDGRKVFAGTMTPSGAIIRDGRKVVAGTLTTTGTISRSISKILAGVLTTEGALAAVKTALVSIGGTLTTAGELVRSTAKSFTGTLTSDGALSRLINKVLAGALTSEGVLTQVRTFLVSVAGTLESSGTLLKSIAKSLEGTATTSGTITRLTAKTQAGTITSAGATSKETQKPLAGTVTSAGSLSRVISKVLDGTLTTAGAISKVIAKAFAGALSFVGTLASEATTAAVGIIRAWTLRNRDTAWSLANRDTAWSLKPRDTDFSLDDRDTAWSLKDRDTSWNIEDR